MFLAKIKIESFLKHKKSGKKLSVKTQLKVNYSTWLSWRKLTQILRIFELTKSSNEELHKF